MRRFRSSALQAARVSIASMAALFCVAGAAWAGDEGVLSTATELGARAGAMNYCKDHHGGSKSAQYGIVALSTLKQLDKLSSDDKTKALVVAKKVEESGDYLGKPLDEARCDSLRKLAATGDVVDAVK